MNPTQNTATTGHTASAGITPERAEELGKWISELIISKSRLERENAELRAALEEIAEGSGAFSRDPLTHAANCIDNMKSIARAALANTKGGA
jgi:hypothetical protein